MDIAAAVIAGIVGLAVGVWLGLRLGARLSGGGAWRYWMWNIITLATGMLLAFAGQVAGALWISVAGLGLAGGGITGLKYGYGASVGVWAIHDRLVGSDDLPEQSTGGRSDDSR